LFSIYYGNGSCGIREERIAGKRNSQLESTIEASTVRIGEKKIRKSGESALGSIGVREKFMAEINGEDALKNNAGAEHPQSFMNPSAMEGGRDVPPIPDEDGKQWVRTSMLIQCEAAQKLYGIWHNVEATPLWQEQIMSVVRTGEKTSHWMMQTSTGTLEWDSEIVADEPGKRIVWQSVGGESVNAGEVVFEPEPDGHGTYVSVLQEFRMGKMDIALETVRGRNPKQAVIENLRHFKAMAETGEIPRTAGQLSGPRKIVGRAKWSVPSQNISEQPGLEKKAA
jgi:uncharacterized membrane protein